MIYKFEKDSIDLEVELVQENDESIVLQEFTNISLKYFESQDWLTISLTKKDVYHLIGALHLIHKEMK